MSDRYSFEDLKNEEVLVGFLQRVWLAGVATGKLSSKLSVQECKDKFMPDFKNQLERK